MRAPPSTATAESPAGEGTAPLRAAPRAGSDWRWRLAPVIVAAVGSALYLLVDPRTVDLAAGTYRADLFGREGFTIWNGNWYSGHHTPGYSVLFPPLAWLLGTGGIGAVSTVASAAIFESLARRQWGEPARWGALWFGAAALTPLYAGRIPFGLGATFALGAALAMQRGRLAPALALAVVSALVSPIASLLLAMVAMAHWLVTRRRSDLALAAAALAPPLLLALVFPDSGRQPFDLSAFVPLPLFCVAFYLAIPREERTLRVVAAIYFVAGVLAYVVDTPMGGNAVRLGALLGGPVLLCVLAVHGWPSGRRRRIAVAGLLVALAVWQWSPPVRDLIKGFEDPSVEAAYYRPLLRFLEQQGDAPFRVEIPFTRSHWETAEVAPHFPLARGWLRSTDIERNSLFYGGVLNRVTYATWLAEHGIRFVALPSAKPDYSSYRERALIESEPPYLRPVFRSRDWRVYQVTLPHRMVVSDGTADMRLRELGSDSAVVDVRRPGEAVVRVEWTPYWLARGACVERDGEWTRLIATRPGPVRMVTSFSPERVFSRGRRCG